MKINEDMAFKSFTYYSETTYLYVLRSLITSGPAGPSCVKGESRCSAENQKDSKLSCSATQSVLNRPRLKLAGVT